MPHTLGVLKHDDSAVRKGTKNRHNSGRMLGATQLATKNGTDALQVLYIYIYMSIYSFFNTNSIKNCAPKRITKLL